MTWTNTFKKKKETPIYTHLPKCTPIYPTTPNYPHIPYLHPCTPIYNHGTCSKIHFNDEHDQLPGNTDAYTYI